MSFWWWVLIFVGIAAVGLGLYAVLGLRLWRKVRSLMGEVARLTGTVASLETTLASAGGGPVAADDSTF